MHIVALISVASACLGLGTLGQAELLPGELDLCEGLSDTSSNCTESNCLCRLQSERGLANDDSFFSIEEGCIAEQSCPELHATTTISEPVKCQLSASSGSTTFSVEFNNFNSAIAVDDSGVGTVLTIPAGLRPGHEGVIKYDAVGESGLTMGFGIACDGFLYLLGKGPSSGSYSCSETDVQGKCLDSCTNCVLCGASGANGFGHIYTPSSYVQVAEFALGENPLDGVVFIDRTNGNVRSVSVQCALQSKAEEQFDSSAPAHGTAALVFALLVTLLV